MPRTAKSINLDVGFMIFFLLQELVKTWLLPKMTHIFQKFNLTANIVMLLNLEPNFGLMLEIKSILNYPHGHTVSAVRFYKEHLMNQV